jgi:hypothetical protein
MAKKEPVEVQTESFFDDGVTAVADEEASGPASGRMLKPEEKALKAAGKPVVPADPDDKRPPKYGTPRFAGPGPFPRLAHQLERVANNGQKRFKVSLRPNQPTKYLFAADKGAAVAYYCELQGCKADEPGSQLVVTELPD